MGVVASTKAITSIQRADDPTQLYDSGTFHAIQQGIALPTIVVAPQCLPNGEWEPGSLVQFIEHVTSEFRLDRERIHLLGYSMGGYGTWATAAAHPSLFAAIVPICGGGNPDHAASLAGIPVWAFHGEKDDVVPPAESERMIESIRASGGKPQLTVIPDAGHGICNDVCRRDDLWEWLLDQRNDRK